VDQAYVYFKMYLLTVSEIIIIEVINLAQWMPWKANIQILLDTVEYKDSLITKK
jgi:hypothetical protein